MKPAPPIAQTNACVSGLSAAQKAAIVLASLPRETAAAIVAEVGDAHLRTFVQAVSEMKSVPVQTRLLIAQEFIAEVMRQREALPGGSKEARRILAEITDPARVERIISDAKDSALGSSGLWERAAALPAETLLEYLRRQRPPVAAAILANLPSEKAAEVLSKASAEFASAVIGGVVRFSQPDAETSQAIAAAIEADLLSPSAAGKNDSSPSEQAAAIFDLLPSSLRNGLLDHLEIADAPMAAAIRKSLTTFEQLPDRLSESAVAALFRTVERDILLKALKQGESNAPSTVDHLLSNISKRMAEQYREDLAALPAPTQEEGEAAQRKVLATVKQLARSGEIKLN